MKRSGTRRSLRMGDEIRRVLGELLLDGVQDPRLELVSITGVRLNTDLSVAEVLYTAMGGPERTKAAGQALERAGGFLRTEMGKRLKLRYLPELRFKPDDFLEDMLHGAHGPADSPDPE
ncbi:MAG: 30S ribosome-binding factor RbfA [Desulfovibrionaceae bacterium]